MVQPHIFEGLILEYLSTNALSNFALWATIISVFFNIESISFQSISLFFTVLLSIPVNLVILSSISLLGSLKDSY
jgi:hypothetical protein